MASPLPPQPPVSPEAAPTHMPASPSLDAAAWTEAVLAKLAAACAEGQAAVDFIRARRVKIGFSKQKATGAKWAIDGNIYLNSNDYSLRTNPGDQWMLNLVAHEALHLRQGLFTALSVYGELQAWQLGLRVAQAVGMGFYHPALVELMQLPLAYERGLLAKTRTLMQAYAGPGYRIDLLPFYPLPQEVNYRLTKQLPKSGRGAPKI